MSFYVQTKLFNARGSRNISANITIDMPILMHAVGLQNTKVYHSPSNGCYHLYFFSLLSSLWPKIPDGVCNGVCIVNVCIHIYIYCE